MAKSVLDIIIRTLKEGGADKETVNGLTKVKGAIQQTAAVGATLVAAGYAIKKAFDATVGTMVEYADQVRNVQRATSLSAEEASRLIQMTDDLGVSYETLEKAVKSSADTTDFSIEGLAKASDEYLKITDSNERAKYAQELYGKAWVDMVGVLDKGSAAIRDGSDAIDDSLVLTQDAVDQAREYEIAVDDLSDAWKGFTVTVGNAVLPTVTKMIRGFADYADVQQRMDDIRKLHPDMSPYEVQRQALADVAGATDSATSSYTAWAKAISDGAPAQETHVADLEAEAAAAKAISDTNIVRLGLIGQMQSAHETYNEKYQSIADDMSLTDDQRKAKFDELTAEHDLDTRRIILNMLEQKLAHDGLTTEEMDLLLDKGLAWGLYSQTVVDEAQAAMKEVDALAKEIDGVPNERTVTFNIVTRGDNGLIPTHGTVRRTPGRATGGPVKANSTYIVGEEGPEVFVPNQSGTIIPNGGGASIANGAAGGGSVNVSLTIASPVTIMDEQNAKNVLLPFIIDGIREAQARGAIR